ncbi:hypothetical protein Acr_06g0008290 [Actinidia rufa]|uniref:Uncharacterized protein n=1 Tax=Actinidia rufa TaxID=165716 RepID=A0A7J0ESB9_9ERIC|nr:hypothetical protein Acr_06g0008290 [Actinidia rufa]
MEPPPNPTRGYLTLATCARKETLPIGVRPLQPPWRGDETKDKRPFIDEEWRAMQRRSRHNHQAVKYGSRVREFQSKKRRMPYKGCTMNVGDIVEHLILTMNGKVETGEVETGEVHLIVMFTSSSE